MRVEVRRLEILALRAQAPRTELDIPCVNYTTLLCTQKSKIRIAHPDRNEKKTSEQIEHGLKHHDHSESNNVQISRIRMK